MQPIHLIILSKFTHPIQKSGGVGVLVKDILDTSSNFQALSIHSSDVDGVLALQSRFEHYPNSSALRKFFFWSYISIKFIRFLQVNKHKYRSFTSCNIVTSIILSVFVPNQLSIWENIDYLKQRRALNVLRLRFALKRNSKLIVSSLDEFNKLESLFPKFRENIFYKQNWTPDLTNQKAQHRITCVGFLEERKGFDLLIKHMPIDHELPVHIFGNGSQREALNDLITRGNKNVILEGFTSQGYLEIEKSAGFILPSRFEGAPLVLLHAIKAGIPVAVSEEVSDCEIFEIKLGSYFQKLTISDPKILKYQLISFFKLVNTNNKKLESTWDDKSKCIKQFLDLYHF